MKKISPEVKSALPTITGLDAVPITRRFACPSRLTSELTAESCSVDCTLMLRFRLSAKLSRSVFPKSMRMAMKSAAFATPCKLSLSVPIWVGISLRSLMLTPKWRI